MRYCARPGWRYKEKIRSFLGMTFSGGEARGGQDHFRQATAGRPPQRTAAPMSHLDHEPSRNYPRSSLALLFCPPPSVGPRPPRRRWSWRETGTASTNVWSRCTPIARSCWSKAISRLRASRSKSGGRKKVRRAWPPNGRISRPSSATIGRTSPFPCGCVATWHAWQIESGIWRLQTVRQHEADAAQTSFEKQLSGIKRAARRQPAPAANGRRGPPSRKAFIEPLSAAAVPRRCGPGRAGR